jgi:hypothetical protein
MAPALLACSSCGRYAKSTSPECPECGAALRRPDGTVPRAAAAILLGLATTTMACHPSVSSGGSGGASGQGGAGQSSSSTVATHYGPGPSTGSSSSATNTTLYGPAVTTSTSATGAGGAGGSG